MSKLKVTITKAKFEETDEYPCLMVAKNEDNNKEESILLVTGSKDDGLLIGTIIYNSKNPDSSVSDCSLGEYSDGWEPSYFKPFHGKITLEQ